MALSLGTAALVLVALLWELSRPTRQLARTRLRELWRLRSSAEQPAAYDPGRERRAEQRARELLRSCVSEHDWAMYRDLGFLCVAGALRGERARAHAPAHAREPGAAGADGEEPAYAYLIYPHKPIVAYVPATGELLNEYCVAFPDHTRPYGSARLPDSDDVLAKWMALSADERRLVGEANMHLPGRQVDPDRVRRDLARLARWEREQRERRVRPARDLLDAHDSTSVRAA
ncbi:MAG TPA: hypothetical protein VKV16_07705 [Solirubrobacteraceae bacterium]|nr:hypothetical protein [Solirubrobacteraceae bacterium]